MSYEDVFKELKEKEWAILAAAMKAGDYAFFVASGLSKEAGLLTGGEVAEKLIQIHLHAVDPVQKFRDTHNFGGSLDLPIVAQLLENEIGREKLIKFLRKSINWDVAPAPVHKFITLISLSMKERDKAIRVITTNYDTLVEDSLPPRRDVFVLEEHYREEAHEARPWVLKVHGCIRTSPQETIKITQTDLSQPLEPWKQEAIGECLHRKGLIVVGYGATDIHVSRIINDAIRKATESSYWISTGRPPEKVITSLAERKGRYIPMDAKTFFETARIIEQNRSIENHT
jgi:hypothetical protein